MFKPKQGQTTTETISSYSRTGMFDNPGLPPWGDERRGGGVLISASAVLQLRDMLEDVSHCRQGDFVGG